MDELPGHRALESYPLLEALLRRRSRRFALGARLQGSGLAYESAADPVPLSHEEEAVLAFAGSGVTGHVFGELPYSPAAGPETGGGQVMMSLVGRTSPVTWLVNPGSAGRLGGPTCLIGRCNAYPRNCIGPVTLRANNGWVSSGAVGPVHRAVR